MPEASLIVNGQIHKGWTDISVTRSMEQFAHSFDISFTERWSDEDEAIPIHAGDACRVKLDTTAVITGYVDDDPIDYDANDHKIRVTGRSLTGDLVDCSAIYKKGQWKNASLETIAKNLCEPFAITVRVETDLGDKFSSFAIQDGETVYEALERACRMRGVLMMTNADGELVFTDVGALTTRTIIEFGVNVIRGARMGGFTDRFSKYIIKAQAPGTDDFHGVSASQGKVEVEDSVIPRYRPLIVQTECQSSGTLLASRANWERNVRAGRSRRLQYSLDGWENDEGLWAPNTLVRVKDRKLEVDTELLIITVRQTRDADGTNTVLELADPRSMTVEPLTKQAKKKGDKSPFITGSRP